MKLNLAAYRQTLNFLLFDWLHVQRLQERARFAEHDEGTMAGVLDVAQRLAQDKFAPINRLLDEQEPHFDGQRVHLPQATQEALAAYAESGLLAASADAQWGGLQLPCVVEMAANSFFSAACVSAKGYAMLSRGNANLLLAHGTSAQHQVFAKPQLQGRWFGTMNLSEPQAGSSLSDIATKAVPDGPDFEADPLGPRYRLTGRKMWISGGEHEMGENIVHLVLAKIPDASGALPAGTRGISLFICPKWNVDSKGQLTGERNDVSLAGLNHKLGYRGTVNTLLNYGEKGGAVAYRVGAPGQGLAGMFHMMNEARIAVGLGAAMLGMAGYLQSRDYARERLQGRPLVGASKDATQPQVPLVAHADVRRMLITQKAYVDGAAALCLYCARLVDEQHTGNEPAQREASALLDVLTPIAKSWPSEWALEANSLAIQVLGGYGYTRDYPVEQHWRDNRLNMIHEGTHGIQAQDLLGRKVVMNGGAAFKLLLARMQASVLRARSLEQVAPASGDLGRWSLAVESAAQTLANATQQAWASGDAPAVLANATAYLRAFGHTVLAWIWLDVACAQIEQRRPSPTATRSADEEAAQQSRFAAAQYFIEHELPLVAVWLVPVAKGDDLWLSLPEQAL